MKKPVAHLTVLIALFGFMVYLWLTPTGNIKPGGFEIPLLLMLVGGFLSVVFLIQNKTAWASNKQGGISVADQSNQAR